MTMTEYLYTLLVNTLKRFLGVRSPSAMLEAEIEKTDFHEKPDAHSEENAFWAKLAMTDATKR